MYFICIKKQNWIALNEYSSDQWWISTRTSCNGRPTWQLQPLQFYIVKKVWKKCSKKSRKKVQKSLPKTHLFCIFFYVHKSRKKMWKSWSFLHLFHLKKLLWSAVPSAVNLYARDFEGRIGAQRRPAAVNLYARDLRGVWYTGKPQTRAWFWPGQLSHLVS